MSTPRHPAATLSAADLAQTQWRQSSYSGGANDCVEVAEIEVAETDVAASGASLVAIRDAKDLGLKPLAFGRPAVRSLISSIEVGAGS